MPLHPRQGEAELQGWGHRMLQRSCEASILDEMLYFAKSLLCADAAAVAWPDLDQADEILVSSGIASDFMPSYYQHAHSIDPLSVERAFADNCKMRSLSGVGVDCIQDDVRQYKGFLFRYNLNDEHQFILRVEDRPMALLAVFKNGAGHFSSMDVQWDALHRYLEHNLGLHPRARDWTRRLKLERHIGLTPREIEVAKLIELGASNATIAEVLRITIPTVKCHVINILDKLGVDSRSEVMAILLHM